MMGKETGSSSGVLRACAVEVILFVGEVAPD
jgi:hypothetical protein